MPHPIIPSLRVIPAPTPGNAPPAPTPVAGPPNAPRTGRRPRFGRAPGTTACVGRSPSRSTPRLWPTSKRVETSNLAAYRSYLGKPFIPTLGQRSMGKILPSELQRWVTTDTEHGLSPASVRKYPTLVRQGCAENKKVGRRNRYRLVRVGPFPS